MVVEFCTESQIWASRKLYGGDPAAELLRLGVAYDNKNIQSVSGQLTFPYRFPG